MVNEVNKIIYNTLITERAINLPSVGTISIVRKSAEMASGGRVTPPTYVAEFSSHAEATSIVSAIARASKVDIVSAEDIYYRWLDKVRMVTVISIEGVGRISGKSFYAEPEFIELFNNGAIKPIKIRRKRSMGIFSILLIVFVSLSLVAGGVYWFFQDEIKALSMCAKMNKNTSTETTETPKIESIEPIATTEAIEESTPIEVAETSEVKVVVEDSDAVIASVDETPTVVDDNWTTRDDIRHWVVAGSYSTTENAEIAKKSLEKQYDDIYCDVISLGKMYAVTIFGSAEREECEEFMRSHRKEFNQVWIFTPKANR